jgi:hypothetical protein
MELKLTNEQVFRCLGFHEVKGLKLEKVFQTAEAMFFVVTRQKETVTFLKPPKETA